MSQRKNVLMVFGTRPEAIKLAPVCKEIIKHLNLQCTVCVTGQHREMLDTVLEWFEIEPDFDLNVMRNDQSLHDITANIVIGISEVIKKVAPDLVLVHGDTATTFAASFAAFLSKIPVAHVEAGLRTGNIMSPWPEEANRKLTSVITNLHYAPTKLARENLLKEGYDKKSIYVTGNTVVDSLLWTKQKIEKNKEIRDELNLRYRFIDPNLPLLLVTAHRRENIGENIDQLCDALKTISKMRSIQIILPVHLNPKIKNHIEKILSRQRNIFLTDPLPYLDFVYLMDRCSIILTDSGGIQEEAPSLNKPVLVFRETTERPEAVETGAIKIIGSRKEGIIENVVSLLDQSAVYNKMASAKNPFGNGDASRLIVESLDQFFNDR
jgi:UDP-N-acetylglucosamine 2-epimerase (non-hydrolysing)